MFVMARLTGDLQHLARYVADRRGELGLTQQQVQAAGGPSVATQSLIEAGTRQSIQTILAGRLEKALRWETGSVRAILAGGEPTPLPRRSRHPDEELPTAEFPEIPESVRAEVSARTGVDYRVLDLKWPDRPGRPARRMMVLWEGPLPQTPQELDQIRRELAQYQRELEAEMVENRDEK